MSNPPPFVMPGYHFDGKKYYKLPPGVTAPPAASTSSPSAGPSQLGRGTSTQQRTKKQKTAQQQQRKQSNTRQSQPGLGLSAAAEREPGSSHASRRHQLDCLSMSKLKSGRIFYPDCLPVDESICCLSFDDASEGCLRLGGDQGTIATGWLERSDAEFFPNDEQGWRTSWLFQSKVTSLATVGDRFLATCLGQPAQAIVGTTSDTISLASVTLAPRKTSLWTSALSSNLLALGCDRKVLLSTDPTSPQMDAYVTGGKHGGGAVFALNLAESMVYAGTRAGKVKMFDRRSTRTEGAGGGEAETRPEVQLSVASSVTHVQRFSHGQSIVVAAMDGSLGVYDLRFPGPRPLLSLAGHANSFSLELGFALWNDNFVAAAGQDCRVRLWSLQTGAAVFSAPPEPSPAPQRSLLHPTLPTFNSQPEFDESTYQVGHVKEPLLSRRKFDEPIRALSFNAEIEQGWGVSLWVADGGAVEEFSVA